MQAAHLLPRAHEELVVTAVAAPAFDEPDDVPELDEPDDVPEVEAPEGEEPGVEPELDDWPAVEATFVAFTADFARAGSFPVTSCAKIPPELARNNAVAVAATRVRMSLIRRLRSRRRSATRRLAPDPAAERGAGEGGTGTGEA
jgi:hypothetical protein